MATYRWTGAGGDDLLGNQSNWDPQGIPASADQAEFPAETASETVDGQDLTIGELIVDSGNSLTLSGNLTTAGVNDPALRFNADAHISGALTIDAGVRYTGGDGKIFVDGTVTLAGGTLNTNSGGAVSLGSGGRLSGHGEVNDNSGLFPNNGFLAGSGSVVKASGGTLTLDAGSGFNQFSYGSTITGSGTLKLEGRASLFRTSSITVAEIEADNTRVGFTSDTSYRGAYSQTGGYLDVIGNAKLNLRGTTSLTGVDVTDSALGSKNTLSLYGMTALDGTNSAVQVDSGTTLRNLGTLSQSGDLTLGNGQSETDTLQNTANGHWTFTDDGDVSVASGSTGVFANAGTLSKTGGTGTSEVDGQFRNGGTVSVSSGTLDFTGRVTSTFGEGDTGTFSISQGATLAFGADGGVQASQTVDFDTGGGMLQLDNSHKFRAHLDDFGTNDSVLLGDFTSGAKDRFVYRPAADGMSGTLVVRGGAGEVASLTLAGSYQTSDFHLQSTDKGVVLTVSNHA